MFITNIKHICIGIHHCHILSTLYKYWQSNLPCLRAYNFLNFYYLYYIFGNHVHESTQTANQLLQNWSQQLNEKFLSKIRLQSRQKLIKNRPHRLLRSQIQKKRSQIILTIPLRHRQPHLSRRNRPKISIRCLWFNRYGSTPPQRHKTTPNPKRFRSKQKNNLRNRSIIR